MYLNTSAKVNGKFKKKKDKKNGYAKTQKEAEQQVKKLSVNSRGGEVLIHRLDGKIGNYDTVITCNDPGNVKDTKH